MLPWSSQSPPEERDTEACLVGSPYSTNAVMSMHITISHGSSKDRHKHVEKAEHRRLQQQVRLAPHLPNSPQRRSEMRSAEGWEKDHLQTELKCQKKTEEFKGAASDNHMERSSKSLIMKQRQIKIMMRYQGTTIRNKNIQGS